MTVYRMARMALAVGLLSHLPAGAVTRYVSTTGSNNFPYTTWETASTSIRAALLNAQSGDTVVVDDGVYTINQEILVGNAKLLISRNGAHATTIDGSNAVTCVVLTGSGRMSGFTITRGQGSTSGGGVRCFSGAEVADCVIVSNTATFGGGAWSTGTLRNCRIEANHGGGVYGGTVTDCLVVNNTRGATDSGLYRVDARNSTLDNNANYESTLTNCVLIASSGLRSRLDHCTVAGPADLSQCTIRNSILVNAGSLAASTVEYSCTSNVVAGTGNVTGDPLFVNAASHDFRLAAGSPCLDAADPNSVAVRDRDGLPRPLDGDGDELGVSDMGAHEFTGEALNCQILAAVTHAVAPTNLVFEAFVSGVNTQGLYYWWDFGDDGVVDGEGAGLSQVTFLYERPGVYSARLTVSNSVGEVKSILRSDWVSIAPPVDFQGTPLGGSALLDVVFTAQAWGIYSDAYYGWDFDGNGIVDLAGHNLNVVTNLYWQPGLQSVSLIISNTLGDVSTNTRTAYINVGAPDLFSGFPLTVYASQTVTFDALHVVPAGGALYRWDFEGDGTVDIAESNRTSVTHVYDHPGDKHVTLTISNAAGQVVTDAKTNVVRVLAPARLAASPAVGAVPLQVSFTAETWGVYAEAHCRWDFDADGIIDQAGDDLFTVAHTYSSTGFYAARVTLSNAVGDVSVLTVPTPVAVYAVAHYVSPEGGNVPPYTNWATAATNVLDAVGVATTGAVVLVTNGYYLLPGTLVVDEPVLVYGVNGAEQTVLDAQGLFRGAHVVGTNAILDGFTVQRGLSHGFGAGVHVNGGAIVRNCILRDNRLSQGDETPGGGGAYVGPGSTLRNCLVMDNIGISFENWGVGVYVRDTGLIDHCTIVHNRSDRGSGVGLFLRTPTTGATVRNSIIAANVSNPNGLYWVQNWQEFGNPSTLSYTATYPAPPGIGNSPNVTEFDASPSAYWPSFDSPCIDAADPNSVVVEDLRRGPRPLDGNGDGWPRADMGAFEFSAGAFTNGIAHVDQDAAGVADGTSWQDAFPTLQSALAVVPPGISLWVAEGVYRPGSQPEDSFSIPSGVQLYGGFAGNESNFTQRSWSAHVTVLNGDLATNDAPVDLAVAPQFGRADNARHVLELADSTVLDGVWIVGGYAYHTNGAERSATGGGILLDGTSPAIRNCSFADNYGRRGGALALLDGAAPVVDRCMFGANAAEEGGATFSDGAPIFRRCVFGAMEASDAGGCALFTGDHRARVENSLLVGNRGESGGAFAVQGGGLHHLDFVHCTFSHNLAHTGGALAVLSNDTVNGWNSILWNDVSTDGSGTNEIALQPGASVGLYACWVQDDLVKPSPAFAAAVTGVWSSAASYDPGRHATTFSAQDASWVTNAFAGWMLKAGTNDWRWFVVAANSTTSVTVFGSAPAGAVAGDAFALQNFDLQLGSPCINTGADSASLPYDLLGRSRPKGAHVDMGAYESAYRGWSTPPFTEGLLLQIQ